VHVPEYESSEKEVRWRARSTRDVLTVGNERVRQHEVNILVRSTRLDLNEDDSKASTIDHTRVDSGLPMRLADRRLRCRVDETRLTAVAHSADEST